MARDRDREFSEGKGLENLDKDWLLPGEGEERQPAWAARMEEAREKKPDESTPPAEQVEKPRRQGREKTEESGNSASASQESKQRAQEAWAREAKKAEDAAAKEQDEADGTEAKPPKRKPGKPAPKKKSRKKRKSSDQEERRGFVRSLVIAGVCVFLFLMVAVMVAGMVVAMMLCFGMVLCFAVVSGLGLRCDFDAGALGCPVPAAVGKEGAVGLHEIVGMAAGLGGEGEKAEAKEGGQGGEEDAMHGCSRHRLEG